MTLQIDPQDVLTYFRNDEWSGGIPTNDFRLALEFFTALLGTLEESATEQALTNLALHLDDRQRAWLNRLAQAANRIDEAGMAQTIDEELYHAQKEPRFGERNPELMHLPFWQFMIRRGWSPWRARTQFDRACQEYMKQLSKEPPDSADVNKMSPEELEAWGAKGPQYKFGSAVWSFWRFGKSYTKLPDGREIWIAGEHEDWYDPDFYIYNDVIVIHPNLEIEIYGYPRDIFAPTDFHSATLVGESIYIIGSLGYFGTRVPGETPVYRLDCQTFQIEKIATTGENPGWIHGHKAEYVAQHNAIKVTEGKVFLRWEGKRQFRQNRKSYWLALATAQWSSGRTIKVVKTDL